MSCFNNCRINKRCMSCCEEERLIPCGCDRRGPRGPRGFPGPAGPQGLPGGLLRYADFYALMPGDNATPIAAGGDISFPVTAAIGGTGISRLSATSFGLAPGVYQVSFNVTTTEAGQLVLTLNGTELP